MCPVCRQAVPVLRNDFVDNESGEFLSDIHTRTTDDKNQGIDNLESTTKPTSNVATEEEVEEGEEEEGEIKSDNSVHSDTETNIPDEQLDTEIDSAAKKVSSPSSKKLKKKKKNNPNQSNHLKQNSARSSRNTPIQTTLEKFSKVPVSDRSRSSSASKRHREEVDNNPSPGSRGPESKGSKTR